MELWIRKRNSSLRLQGCERKVLGFESLENRVLLSATDSDVLAEQGFDPTAETSTIYVTTSEDITNSGDGVISLREALGYASSSGTTIKLSGLSEVEIDQELIVRKSLTITAGSASVVLSTSQEIRLIQVMDSGTVLTIDNIILKNGTARQNDETINSGQGGAIRIATGSEVILNRCRLSGNESSGDGGAIYSLGLLTIQDTVFEANRAGGNGGALAVNLGTQTEKTLFVNIINSDFMENSAAKGGALYFKASTVTSSQAIQISDTSICSNTAITGGGIFNENTPISIISSQIKKNTATSFGGGLYNSSDNSFLNLEQNEISGNQGLKGGGLYNEGYTVSFDNEYTGNLAKGNNTSAWGGALCNYSSIYSKGDRFTENLADGIGGALFNYGSIETSAQIDLTNAKIDGNIAGGEMDGGGGGIYNQGKITLYNSTLTNNRTGENTFRYGGAIQNQDSGIFDIVNCVFTDNYAYQGGGAIDNAGQMTITHSTLMRNETKWLSTLTMSDSGGGAISNKISGVLTISSVLFLANKSYYGGAIRNWAETYSTDDYHGSLILVDNSYCRENIDTKRIGIESDYNYSNDGQEMDHVTTRWSSYQYSLPENACLVLRDSQGNRVDQTIVFEAQAIAEMGRSVTYTLCNEGETDIAFTSPTGLNEGGFASLSSSLGTFTLAAGKSVEIELTLQHGSTGEKASIFRWNVGENVDGKDTYFQLFATYVVADSVGTVSANNITLSDTQTEGSYTVQLSQEPLGEVTVYLQTEPGIVLSKNQLVFTEQNWNVAQTVNIQRNMKELGLADQPLTNAVIRHVVYSSSGSLGIENSIYFNQGLLDDVVVHFAPYLVCQEGTYPSSNPEEKEIIYQDVFPDVSATINSYGQQDRIITLNMDICAESFGNVAQWQINWGDGEVFNCYRSSTTLATAHYYKTSGTYDITLTIINDNGQGKEICYYLGATSVEPEVSAAALLDSNLILDSNLELDLSLGLELEFNSWETDTLMEKAIEKTVEKFFVFDTNSKDYQPTVSFPLQTENNDNVPLNSDYNDLNQASRDAVFKEFYLESLSEQNLVPSKKTWLW